MEWYKWFFDGIGTEILSLIIGLIIGGVSGYKICERNKTKQLQKAGDNASQSQIGIITVADQRKSKDEKR